jgi:hypothetical protein
MAADTVVFERWRGCMVFSFPFSCDSKKKICYLFKDKVIQSVYYRTIAI